MVETHFVMDFNVKTLAIYCGIACLLMYFVGVAILYLTCKLKSDVSAKKRKFLQEQEASVRSKRSHGGYEDVDIGDNN